MLEIFLRYYYDYYETPISNKRYNRLRYLKWRYNKILNEKFEYDIQKN